ncbi:hypothetical protein EVAR_98454_1 [Eumeta japonica]|uniref:Uncharacterized protein n=1 Tax=Eumeta variegata TaxID=151549 RepID=A0A4C1YMT9_EUMVA|nr:hypothetical protein EVAR_98454_1 [Eumeta japonica]
MWHIHTFNACGGIDDKIDDVCELMKDMRLNILCVNDTKRKTIGGTVKADPSVLIGLALIRANEDAAVLDLSYQKDCLNV